MDNPSGARPRKNSPYWMIPSRISQSIEIPNSLNKNVFKILQELSKIGGWQSLDNSGKPNFSAVFWPCGYIVTSTKTCTVVLQSAKRNIWNLGHPSHWKCEESEENTPKRTTMSWATEHQNLVGRPFSSFACLHIYIYIHIYIHIYIQCVYIYTYIYT